LEISDPSGVESPAREERPTEALDLEGLSKTKVIGEIRSSFQSIEDSDEVGTRTVTLKP
jgi:hypothetical protein